MKTEVRSVREYLDQIPAEKQADFEKLYKLIGKSLPSGFLEHISYGMIGWSIPLQTYPAGYHCKPNTPLPFISLAAQKNFFALYHMGIYAKPDLLTWFQEEYPKYSAKKLDMGKSCIRFKKGEDIPYDLIAALCQKITPEEYISIYEKEFKK